MNRLEADLLYTDTHAHLSLCEQRIGRQKLFSLLDEYDQLWQGSADTPKPFIVDVGTVAGDLASRLGVFGRYAWLKFSAGIWPSQTALEHPDESLFRLKDDCGSGRVAAVGECGLDYFHMAGSRNAQIRLFEQQIELAGERSLPLIVHSRDAFEDTLSVLKTSAASLSVIIHCFSYSPAEAEQLLMQGFYLSFAGNLSYRNASGLREALRIVPDSQLLLETDAPYLNPEPFRGKHASSADIVRTYEIAAGLRNSTSEKLAGIVQQNAETIFGTMLF